MQDSEGHMFHLRMHARRISLEPVDSRLVYHGWRLEDARSHLGGLFAVCIGS